MRTLLIVTALAAFYFGGTALGVYGLFNAAMKQIEITRAISNEAPRSGRTPERGLAHQPLARGH